MNIRPIAKPLTRRNKALILPNLHIIVFNEKTGESYQVVTHNDIVKSGREQIRDILGWPIVAGPNITPDYMAIGTDSTATQDTDTALGAEEFRKQLTRKAPDESVAGNPEIIYQMHIATSEANGYTYTEAALFTASSGVDMLSRAVFSGIVKSTALSVTFNWVWEIKTE